MKSFALTSGLRWCLSLLTLLLFASCGGNDSNTSSQVVTSSNGSVAGNAFTATLSGGQETPSNASSASATGGIVIDPVSRLMNGTVVTAGIVGTMAHIHAGAAGVAGPIVFPLAETAAGSGIWTAHTIVTDAQINLFKAGGYYFNVHSAAFPAGEIRGQITAQLQTSSNLSTPGNRYASYTNLLTGSQAVPASASVANALSVTVLDSLSKTLSGSVVSVGATGNAAHVHSGASGQIGPVLFTLAETGVGSGVWWTKTPVTDAQTAALTAGNDYYDIHSAAFPGGDVRGQIVVTAGATPSSAVIITPATTGVALNVPATTPAAASLPAPAMTTAAMTPAATVPAASVPVAPATTGGIY